MRPVKDIAVVMGRSSADQTVHVVRMPFVQNGADKMALCGRHGRVFKVTRAASCRGCLRVLRSER